jgi:hypothetical protein
MGGGHGVRHRGLLVLFLVAVFVAVQAVQPPPDRPILRPTQRLPWVAFTADLKITHPKRPDQYGRFAQDEHGCRRMETVLYDGTAMVSLTNYEHQKFYQLMRGVWTVQPMRIGPIGAPAPPSRARAKKLDPIEGFDAWLSSTPVKSPRGDYIMESTIIPALNDFEAVRTSPSGETTTAFHIKVGAVDHREFEPPPGAVASERPGYGGFMSFAAVVVHAAFEGAAPVELTTMEEDPAVLRTPGGDTLSIVTTVTDSTEAVVRVRVMKNAKKVRTGLVEGDTVDEIIVKLGDTGRTSKLVENFSVTVIRVGGRTRTVR